MPPLDAPYPETGLEPDVLVRLQAALGYVFSDPSLPSLALTHSSYSNERGREDNYERLEFLGDAVLGLVTSQWLYLRFPEEPEGRLAKLKSFLVSATVLSEFSRGLGLGAMLRLGVGEDRSGGRKKASILSDALEALIGAIYLDGGLERARPLIERVLEQGLDRRNRVSHTDSKTRLQEVTQGAGLGLPRYELIGETGPDHEKLFTVECYLEGRLLSKAEGRSKKTAEQAAAAEALTRLDLPQDDS